VRVRGFLSSRSSLLLSVPILLVFAVAGWQMQLFSPPYPLRAKLFPLLVAVPMLVIAVYQVATEVIGSHRKEHRATERTSLEVSDSPGHALSDGAGALVLEGTATPTSAQLRQGLLWFAAFFVALWALGFLIAVPLFTLGYYVFAGGDRWYWGLLGAVVSLALLWGMFDQWLHIPLLHGAIFTALGFS
jgi:hypothetical protein